MKTYSFFVANFDQCRKDSYLFFENRNSLNSGRFQSFTISFLGSNKNLLVNISIFNDKLIDKSQVFISLLLLSKTK